MSITPRTDEATELYRHNDANPYNLAVVSVRFAGGLETEIAALTTAIDTLAVASGFPKSNDFVQMCGVVGKKVARLMAENVALRERVERLDGVLSDVAKETETVEGGDFCAFGSGDYEKPTPLALRAEKALAQKPLAPGADGATLK